MCRFFVFVSIDKLHSFNHINLLHKHLIAYLVLIKVPLKHGGIYPRNTTW
ncbi:hypothetical protein VCRA2119O48_20142 [Vibrio crassostreae]|nr:hypothetical protein VCRA2119O48_20142 [Vibrio crassostreae]CAK2565676.1 hypothetical protein VCRA2122O10_100031 [Vibrio crassostreae]